MDGTISCFSVLPRPAQASPWRPSNARWKPPFVHNTVPYKTLSVSSAPHHSTPHHLRYLVLAHSPWGASRNPRTWWEAPRRAGIATSQRCMGGSGSITRTFGSRGTNVSGPSAERRSPTAAWRTGKKHASSLVGLSPPTPPSIPYPPSLLHRLKHQAQALW